jgi:glycosyltransferase involved in cell wall biosynthesis
MKICFIADANSIHARRWIEYFCESENEVHILSTRYCPTPLARATIHNLSKFKYGERATDGIGINEGLSPAKQSRSRIGRLVLVRAKESERAPLAYFLYQSFRLKGKAEAIIKKLQPDLIHCIRLPLEGYIGGLIGYRPLALTTWGNDMVYFAQKSRLCRWLTKKAMSQVDLYFADSLRDKYIAELYGFSPSSLTIITPVTGGLKLKELPLYRKEPQAMQTARQKLGISPEANLIISVRGFKFFYSNIKPLVKAIPNIVKSFPNTLFVLKGDTQLPVYSHLKRLARELSVGEHIRFTDRFTAEELTDYFTASDIMVSVTTYDGCPVSMLEGMAYGLIPVMSLHSPIQGWVTEGGNGYLFNPKDPQDIAQTLIRALSNRENFEVMRQRNWDILSERADYDKNMKTAEEMYYRLIERKK